MKKITNFEKNHEFSRQINELIPAGAHTYSKADDQFPYNAPKGIVKGKGVYVWDVDGNKYIDWTMGLTAIGLGHAYEPVLDAVKKQLELGSNFQRPATIELEFAELLKQIFPYFDMFKFAKNGSTATTSAVKLARAYTKREIVAVCADHPFFSYDDWFIGTTACDAGIPEETKMKTVKFHYNDINSVKEMFRKYEGQIAAVILEPAKFEGPKDDFLHKLQEECKKNKTVFILDEMITGFRFDIGGAQKYFNIEPDLSTFGKAIGNGFSVAVLAGKKEIMEIGSIIPGKERVFLASTTHGSEAHAIAEAIAVIKEIREKNIIEKNWKLGKEIIERTNNVIEKNGLSEYIEITGFSCWPLVNFKDHNKQISLEFKTLFMQEMIKRGILFQGTFTIAYMHTEKEIDITMEAFDESCRVYKKAIEKGTTDGLLIGEPIKPVFRKIN